VVNPAAVPGVVKAWVDFEVRALTARGGELVGTVL